MNIKKNCIREDQLPIDFEYMDFYKFALKKLPGDRFFIFDHIRNYVFIRVDRLDWLGFL